MKNKEYWRMSLEAVLLKEEVTDGLIQDIINISEMEWECCDSQAHLQIKEDINPLKSEIDRLNHKIGVLESELCEYLKVDWVDVIDNKIKTGNCLI